VLAIKQTLYRAGHDSPLVDALVAAANAGKDVTVIVELRARFDEEANIELSNRLQEAGAHVMYGVVGYKTHAKLTLIVRREAGGIRRYCHLGTGNYHPRTARHYTDYGLFTCDDEIGQDVHEVFLQLTSLTQTPKLNRLEHSRVFYFENGGAPDMFCASADWMERNFFRRVEVAFPVRREGHAERILRDLDFCLQDNCQAWKLQPDGRYVRISRGGERAVS